MDSQPLVHLTHEQNIILMDIDDLIERIKSGEARATPEELAALERYRSTLVEPPEQP